MRLAARCGAGFRPPRRDRRVREPHRQTAPPSQCRVISRAVRDPIARFRDMMTMLGVVFERHRGVSGCLRGSSLRRSSPGRQPQPIRATTSPAGPPRRRRVRLAVVALATRYRPGPLGPCPPRRRHRPPQAHYDRRARPQARDRFVTVPGRRCPARRRRPQNLTADRPHRRPTRRPTPRPSCDRVFAWVDHRKTEGSRRLGPAYARMRDWGCGRNRPNWI